MRIAVVITCVLLLTACASTHETDQLRRGLSLTGQELGQVKTEVGQKTAGIENEMESLRKRQVNLSTAVDRHDEDIRTMMGKLDELRHELEIFRKEMKANMTSIKKGEGAVPTKAAAQANDDAFEAPYKDAFNTFQRGIYPEAAQKLTAFVGQYPNSPVTPNAFFWLGETHLALGEYEKAILDYQELLDRWPKSDMAPKACLSQADAFAGAHDKKSSMTVLKKVMELYPKTEEAAIAERKLRNL